MINDPWLKTSIMTKRGLAKGQAGKRHELSITAQGDFHYVYGPYAKPVLTINPGDVVVVETEDAFGGVITSEKDSPTAKLQFPFLNPQCGPVAVSGTPNGTYEAVRDLLRVWHVGGLGPSKPDFSPLSVHVEPGMRVAIKPNLVLHTHPSGDAAMVTPCCAAIERSPETANSRPMMITTIQARARPSSTREMNAADISSLSAIGSRSAPRRVIFFIRRAK